MANGDAVRIERREKLIAGALSLLNEKPFAAVTVEDLAERSGLPYWQTYRSKMSRLSVFKMAVFALGNRISTDIGQFKPDLTTISAAIRTSTHDIVHLMVSRDYINLLALLVREGRSEPWIADVYRDKVESRLVAYLTESVRHAGIVHGCLALFQEGTVTTLIRSLEKDLVLPQLHPAHDPPNDDASLNRIEAGAAAHLMGAVYTLGQAESSAA